MISGQKSVSSSSPTNAYPHIEYGYAGSADIQEEGPATRQDIEENPTGHDSADTPEGDREPKETETGEIDNSDSEKDLQETENPETDA